MSDSFGAPASSAGIQWADHSGALLLVEPLGFEPSIATSYGETSAVRAHVTFLDGASAGETFRDTLIFPKVLQSQVKNPEHQFVLGRLGQGEKKPGQSPPWKLAEATAADAETARKHLASVAAPPF